jgi:hypothetical protein
MGTWEYEHLSQVVPARYSLERMYGLLTGPLCGWPEDRVVLLQNERSPGDLPDQLMAVFEDVTDVALFYYVGHGQIDSTDQLCLGLTGSRSEPHRRGTTSLPYSAVRQALPDHEAATKVVILDCCFAALATSRDGRLAATPDDILDKLAGTGAYTMAAARAYATAWYETDPAVPQPQTYFTRYLADLIESGIPGQPEVLRLHALFNHVRDRLLRDRRPEPVSRNIDAGREFRFAYNNAPPEEQRDPELVIQDLTRRLEQLQAQASGPGAMTAQQHELQDSIQSATRSRNEAIAARAATRVQQQYTAPTDKSRRAPSPAGPDRGASRFAEAGPGFAPPYRVPADAGSPGIISWPRRGPARGLMLVASAAVAASLIAIAILHSLGNGPSPASSVSLYSSDSYGFSNPDSIAVDGHTVWVANLGGSVTELNADNGNLLRTMSKSSYGFSSPEGIAADGTHVWVTNLGGGANGRGSVTELNASDGSLVQILSGGSYGFNGPWGIATDGTDVWIANYGHPGVGNSVTELNASTGSWVRTLHGFKYPFSVAVGGPHVWVANGNSVTELNASDGSQVRTLSGHGYGFNGIQAIAADGTHVWTANYGGGAGGNGSVTEVNAGNGTVARILSDSSYSFNNPQGITSDGTHVWVAANGESVAELNAGNGSLVRILSGGSYGFSNPWSIAVNGTHVWVANHQGNSVTEFATG